MKRGSGSTFRERVDSFFEITFRKSTVGREIRGGLVTFMTMAYIVILNPLILGGVADVAGGSLDRGQIGAVTALTAGVMTILIRNIGSYADGTVFAILLINLINPLIDRIRPKALGKVVKNA